MVYWTQIYVPYKQEVELVNVCLHLIKELFKIWNEWSEIKYCKLFKINENNHTRNMCDDLFLLNKTNFTQIYVWV